MSAKLSRKGENKAVSKITINILDERLQKLEELAIRLKTTPEELVRASVEDLLTRSEEEFQIKLDYLLKKNEELYRRLA
jgi:predicted transcriptional regulator